MKKRLKKILVFSVTALFILCVVGVSGSVWLVRRAWPQVSGTIPAAGLTGPVQVIRDQWGVPHIYAQNEHDLFFAQGYVHAQDRLWQMDFDRRLGSGELSSLLGQPAVDSDRYLHTLGARRAAEKEWDSLDGNSRAILEAYAAGVNAYIETHRDSLPVEFTLLGASPSPWTPVDTLTLGRMFSVLLSWNSQLELVRAHLIRQLGVKAAEQLMAPYGQGHLILPSETYTESLQLKPSIEAVLPFPQNPYEKMASNNWAVTGSRTATGLPLLANDTHLPLQMPSLWYENGLQGGAFNSVGFTFAGVPMIIIGHNNRIAWGVTDLGADVEDTYVEQLDNAQHPTQYQFKGQWYNLDVVRESIQVKDSQPITIQVSMTRHGPILDPSLFSNPQAIPQPLALQSTIADGRIFAALVHLNLATNWTAFRQALSTWDVPPENFVYADVDGNIGYQAAGKLPIRTPQHQGLVPMPGWTGEYEWQGFYDFEQLYHVLNPSQGYVATANDQVFPADYPYPQIYGQDLTLDARPQVIRDTLAANNHITIQDMRNLQADTYSKGAESLRPYLLAVQPQNDLQARALEQVKKWDCRMETDRPGATIYATWYAFLVKNTLGDELGPDLMQAYLSNVWYTLPVMQELLKQPNNPWFDDVKTPQVESRDDIILRSLTDAVTLLSKLYGNAPEQWTWGKYHTVTFVAQPFGALGIDPLSSLFNSPTLPARGGDDTVDVALANGDSTVQVYQSAAQRFILDLSNWDHSQSINSTGQSGLLLHPHRDDMVSTWENVGYHPMLFTIEAVKANAESTLILTPR